MTPEQRFEKNIHLVGFIFQKHFKRYMGTLHHDDLMQEGYIALWRSCRQFKEELGYQFSSYAGDAIRYAMFGYIQKEEKIHEKTISIYEVIADNGEGEEVQLLDTLSVPPETESNRALIEFCIKLLGDFEQSIIRVLLSHHTQKETAKICDTSQATVSRCLAKLRKIILEELKK